MKIEQRAYGKINLALDVINKREDGYHEIRSLMQQIDLYDTIVVRENGKEFAISCDNDGVPLDSTNLAYRAWEEISKVAATKVGIHVEIKKRIPVAAGLAGGSSNGAAVMIALNRMWDLGLTRDELMAIGKNIGADIPFCILGGTAVAEGIGEKLISLRPFKGKMVLLANPGIGISSGYAYNKLKIKKERGPMDEILGFMEKEDLASVASRMFNVFEEVIIPENPVIGKIKATMDENGALGSLMSGSGASVFGLYDDEDMLENTQKKLEKMAPYVFRVATI